MRALGEQSLIAYSESIASSLVVGSLTYASTAMFARHEREREEKRRQLWQWSASAHLITGLVTSGILVLIALSTLAGAVN